MNVPEYVAPSPAIAAFRIPVKWMPATSLCSDRRTMMPPGSEAELVNLGRSRGRCGGAPSTPRPISFWRGLSAMPPSSVLPVALPST